MDSVGPGVAPERNDTNPVALYFIVWIFIGSFFAMNLFVGVIVDNFNQICKGDRPAPPYMRSPAAGFEAPPPPHAKHALAGACWWRRRVRAGRRRPPPNEGRRPTALSNPSVGRGGRLGYVTAV